MYHPPIPSSVDILQPGARKRKMDLTMSNKEPDIDLVGGYPSRDSQILDISRHVSDEVSLEVAIRERLATTIEGRIQWALRMLDALVSDKESQGQPLDEDDFQDAALDALEALEAPSSFIFDTELPEERSPFPSFSPVVPTQPALPRVPKTRSSRTPKPSQQKKHLYIKLPSSTSDGQLAILACPTCSRTQFTTLQGLLNHARLAHGAEWGSHDACIAACAVPVVVDAENWESYERDGVEVSWGGSVVGLRRLFERAVGVDSVLPTLPSAHAMADAFLEDSLTAPSTLLSRTLGLHADSPALAQFLGRAPKRRCIHAYDEEQDVDILTFDSTTSQPSGLVSEGSAQPKKSFYMRYPHRNTARKDLDLIINVNPRAESVSADNTSTAATIPVGTTASRFHIMARIRLEDRSLFLKEDLRTQLGITDQYRWMLGVTAPSYSLPLSSFLTFITVVPPRAMSPVFLTAQQQPFVVIGTANEPFMAKVIFQWVGGGKMEVEHWIELDQSRSCSSVFGSEQLLDVELDRNTPLLPVPEGSPPPLPSLDRLHTFDSSNNVTQPDSNHGDTLAFKDEYYEQILRSLLPKVPMTARDIKPRTTIEVPYRLVASPAHLLTLVPGRRKAIEWARARTLHALYIDHTVSVSPPQLTVLTVGDVYMFLEDASHFPRPSHPTSGPPPEPKKKGREKDRTPILGEESCPTCGIKKRLHPGYDLKTEEDAIDWTCAAVPTAGRQYGASLPLTNLSKVLTWSGGLQQAVRGPSSSTSSVPSQALKIFLPPCQYTPRDLLSLNSPEFTLAVHKVASKLRLPTFHDLAPYDKNHTFLTNRVDIERCLAPAALLSATLKPFISTLLRSAIEIAKRDATSLVPGVKTSRGKKTKKLTFTLTPGHILRGLRLQFPNSLRAVPNVARAAISCNSRAGESTALCLARLGVQLDFGKDVVSGPGTDDAEHSMGHTAVKAEPE